jgi:hypothetical protein
MEKTLPSHPAPLEKLELETEFVPQVFFVQEDC